MSKEKFYSIYKKISESLSEYETIEYPVYVPSKDRPKSKTVNNLVESKIPHYLVIEPQDIEKYEITSEYTTLLVMPENDRGIAYVRNFCKEHSILNSHRYHWQLDDNILNFRVRQNNKNIKHDCRNLLSASEYIMNLFDNVGALGLCHTCFAFSKKVDVAFNKQTYSCVLVNNELDIKWRDNVAEDTDYSLQVLSEGYCTIVLNRILINKQVSSANSGGHKNTDDCRMNRALGLQKYWPGAFVVTREYNRVKIKPSRIWKTFTQMPKGPELDLNESSIEKFL